MTIDRLRSGLDDYLARVGPHRERRSIRSLTALTGGWANSLYTVTLPPAGSEAALPATSVLKLYEPDARGSEHARREWRALTELRAVDYPVPGVLVFEPDAGHLGRPFIVMEHLPGAPFWDVFEAADAVARAELTGSFAARLVTLHELDPNRLDPAAGLMGPYDYIDTELARLRRDCAESAHPALARILPWLQRRGTAVPCDRPAILHRDYHAWNVLVTGTDELWVIDWDWQIGDARFDLAWTCMLMDRSGASAFSDAVRDEYGRRSDRPLDDLDFFEVLTTPRWLLNVLPAAAVRADFRAFLIEPVRRAREILRERTGVGVTLAL